MGHQPCWQTKKGVMGKEKVTAISSTKDYNFKKTKTFAILLERKNSKNYNWILKGFFVVLKRTNDFIRKCSALRNDTK